MRNFELYLSIRSILLQNGPKLMKFYKCNYKLLNIDRNNNLQYNELQELLGEANLIHYAFSRPACVYDLV